MKHLNITDLCSRTLVNKTLSNYQNGRRLSINDKNLNLDKYILTLLVLYCIANISAEYIILMFKRKRYNVHSGYIWRPIGICIPFVLNFDLTFSGCSYLNRRDLLFQSIRPHFRNMECHICTNPIHPGRYYYSNHIQCSARYPLYRTIRLIEICEAFKCNCFM